MSLILEALKKSEAERRLGHVPGLLDQGPLQRRRRGVSPLRWIALLSLVLGVAGAAFWFGQRGATLQEAVPTGATATVTPAPAPAPAVSNVAEQSPARTEVPAAASPGRTAEPTTAAPPRRLPSDPGFASVERESRAQQATPLPPPPLVPPIDVPAPVRDTDVPALAATSPAPPSASAPPPAPARADSVPLLSSLGPEARGRLPPFKVSMHVFTEDPAGRVVIIDGRRLREGETVSEGVRLAEIRRDGSVLEIGGRRLLLARP